MNILQKNIEYLQCKNFHGMFALCLQIIHTFACRSWYTEATKSPTGDDVEISAYKPTPARYPIAKQPLNVTGSAASYCRGAQFAAKILIKCENLQNFSVLLVNVNADYGKSWYNHGRNIKKSFCPITAEPVKALALWKTFPITKFSLAFFQASCYTHFATQFHNFHSIGVRFYHHGKNACSISHSFALKNNIFSGMDETHFNPNGKTTRAMFVAVLWRLDGQEESDAANPFVDLKAGSYYEKAVIWAAANKIVAGADPTHFNPNGNVTREQVAAFLYRYARLKGYDLSASANLSTFPDAGSVSKYAKESLTWAVGAGLISGSKNAATGVVYLEPKGNATRAQVAQILMMFAQNIAK